VLLIKFISKGSSSLSSELEMLVVLDFTAKISDSLSFLNQKETTKLKHFTYLKIYIRNLFKNNYFAERITASRTRYVIQQKCTANCSKTVSIVYTLKIFGNGRCFDKVFKGLEREMNKKQVASKMPCNVACVSLNLIPSK
jgi:hypothetical protein